MFDWIIVGAGFTGATLAERIASQLDQKVLLVDRRDHVGGNAYDYYNEHGILVHKYGPHIFHTNSKKVWDYLSTFTEWRHYYHNVLGLVDGIKVPIPFNLNSLYALFPNKYAEKLEKELLDQFGFGAKVPILKLKASTNGELAFLAEYIYEKVFLGYTLKQWGLKPEELSASVTSRVPIHISRDDRYFQDSYQALPELGYSELFRRMLSHPNIKILLNTDYREVTEMVKYRRMIYTGPIDSFFNKIHGELPYRSLRFHFETKHTDRFQEAGTVNYPSEFDFTRITEQKILTGQCSTHTTIIYEYPESHRDGYNDPYYPIPKNENKERFRLYAQEVEKLKGNVIMAGRLADYQYYNMDQVVARALKIFEQDIT